MKHVTDLRVVEDPHGEQFIQGTYEAQKCGCEVRGGGTLQQPIRIERCALHQAAPDLLAACKRAVRLLETEGFDPDMAKATLTVAILKAEPSQPQT